MGRMGRVVGIVRVIKLIIAKRWVIIIMQRVFQQSQRWGGIKKNKRIIDIIKMNSIIKDLITHKRANKQQE